ncbi:uncharacterized protein LODBEIA_P37640 [Lodderomyces beijingensis]|uniref:Uncharacterized protein n=1 Tax=Lodderomyces beijingensis TaxID=1775926 RepID=A0ABP0ZTP3_9ASCO
MTHSSTQVPQTQYKQFTREEIQRVHSGMIASDAEFMKIQADIKRKLQARRKHDELRQSLESSPSGPVSDSSIQIENFSAADFIETTPVEIRRKHISIANFEEFMQLEFIPSLSSQRANVKLNTDLFIL